MLVTRLLRQKFHLWIFWLLAIVLALGLVLPGVQMANNSDAIALVNGKAIPQEDYFKSVSRALESQRERMGGELSEAESARVRKAVLDDMINELLAVEGGEALGLGLGENEFKQALIQDRTFQNEQGVFDPQRYQQFLQAQAERGMGWEETEALIRRSLRLNKTQAFWASQANLSPAEWQAAQALYNRKVRARALVWDYSGIKGGMSVEEDELRDYYSRNRQRWEVSPQVKASHILIKTDALAGTTVAKAKADELYQKAKGGANFAKLAGENSQDEGSAKKGGDLGYFKKGDMVAPFEQAAFNMNVGEISEPVLSQFGWHIIKVEGKKAGFEPTFENSKSKALDELKTEKARKVAQAQALKAGADLADGKTPLDAKAAKNYGARLVELGPLGYGDKAAVPGLGDSASFTRFLLSLEKGERAQDPAQLEKGIVFAEIISETQGPPPSDKTKADERRQAAQSNLMAKKGQALYEGWIQSLRAGAKIKDFSARFGN